MDKVGKPKIAIREYWQKVSLERSKKLKEKYSREWSREHSRERSREHSLTVEPMFEEDIKHVQKNSGIT